MSLTWIWPLEGPAAGVEPFELEVELDEVDDEEGVEELSEKDL
jgi:hypothetical protein